MTEEKAWKRACEKTGQTGIAHAVLKRSDGEYVTAPIYYSAVGTACAVALAFGGEFIKRTHVLT